ncbi:MAG: hypothetical protein IJ125_01250 [Atopobiaceae bacterium]|nr:hypothetical protein [Atopobiaceae bacterium]
MDAHEFEDKLQQLLEHDLAAGSEEFRDALLARCLALLDTADSSSSDVLEYRELDDSELEMLAAAGDVSALSGEQLFYHLRIDSE